MPHNQKNVSSFKDVPQGSKTDPGFKKTTVDLHTVLNLSCAGHETFIYGCAEYCTVKSVY